MKNSDVPKIAKYPLPSIRQVVFEGFFSNENNCKQRNDRRYTQSAHHAKERSRFRPTAPANRNQHPDNVSNAWSGDSNNSNAATSLYKNRSRTSLVGELMENDYDKKRHVFNAPPKTLTQPNPIEPTTHNNSNKIRPPSLADPNSKPITQTPQIDKINEKISDSLNEARLKQQQLAAQQKQQLASMNSISSVTSNSTSTTNNLESSQSQSLSSSNNKNINNNKNNGLKSILSSRELAGNFDRGKSAKSRNVRFPEIMPNKNNENKQNNNNGNYSIYGHQPLKQQSSYHDVYNRPTQNNPGFSSQYASNNYNNYNSHSHNRVQPSRSFSNSGPNNLTSFNSYKSQNYNSSTPVQNLQPLTAQKMYQNRSNMSNPNIYYTNTQNSYNPNRDRQQNYSRSRGLGQESGWNLFGVPRTYSTLYR